MRSRNNMTVMEIKCNHKNAQLNAVQNKREKQNNKLKINNTDKTMTIFTY